MRLEATPVLDRRRAEDVLRDLLALAPGWTPELKAAEGEPGAALFQIFARYMQSVIERLNQAPDRNLLAFLDTFGISLIPPLPARAPVVFTPAPRAADAIVPARTRVSAKIPDSPAPLIFETERQGAMAAARLTEVITLWPARDQYADHSTEAAGKRPFVLFEPARPVEHVLYLAHDTVFRFSGSATIEVEFELGVPGTTPIATRWEFWDGQVWRPFTDIDPSDPESGRDGTLGFTRTGILSLRAGCGESKAVAVNGIQAHWIRGRVDGELAPDPARGFPMIDRIRVRSVVDSTDIAAFAPDAAFAGAQKLDVSNAFYPFDQQPGTGSVFYLSAASAFEKPGAQVTLRAMNAATTLEDQFPIDTSPTLVFEYWDGAAWRDTGVASTTLVSFITSASAFTFTVPKKAARRKVNEQEATWMRMRISQKTFASTNTVTIDSNTINIVTVVGPALQNLLISYTYQSPWLHPDQCLAFSDFQWTVHSRDVRWPGSFFPAFAAVADPTPALYVGFDRPLPNDFVNIYVDVQETSEAAPALVWEAWNGTGWAEIPVEDETGRLTRPGMLSFLPPRIPPRPEAAVANAAGTRLITAGALEAAQFKPGDQVLIAQEPNSELRVVEAVNGASVVLTSPLGNNYTGGTLALAALPRFGVSRDWIRGRLKEDGTPLAVQVKGVYLNAQWVEQVETVTGEVLGGGLGVPDQPFFFNRTPVLPGEQIEVRELDGLRADVEYPMLREELLERGYTDDQIRLVIDARTGKIAEVWVLWKERPHFYFSGPDDRHYVAERTRGRVLFGNGASGKLPPVGSSNIRAREYRAGGGQAGNVPAGAINQIMSGVLASGVTNPRAAEGGADGETPAAIRTRGPHVFRHQERSLSSLDYEALAREASPAVAAVRVLPATAPNGRPAAGSITVIIVPQSRDAQPQPSFELRQRVHDYFAARAPATLSAARIAVIGPVYLPVGVSGILVPRDLSDAGAIEKSATAALQQFLHPLTGGPDGAGWPFGRGVFVSDVASILEAIPGVDHAEFLELRLNDTPVGDAVPVPPDRMVVAGPLRIEIRGD
jgi:hypothetical protein